MNSQQLEKHYSTMTDIKLANEASKHDIPHAVLLKNGDWYMPRQRIIAKLMAITASSKSE
jgi:hypothetical protein